MIIDFHHHLLSEDLLADELVLEMDKAGIDRVCLSGLGIGHGKEDKTDYGKFSLGSLSPDNNDVLNAMKRHPDRILAQGVINLGKDTPETVRRLKDEGFTSLKITRPAKAYNDDDYLPIYEEAEKENMAILFHTGMILTTCFDKDDDADSERMRPMLLDRVARHCPDLKMVIAHMGYPWFDEAATMLRYHKNVYIDFTASSYGWRNRLSPAEFQKYLFWKDAFDKVVFGTDVSASDIGEALNDQRQLFDLLNLTTATKEKIFSLNAEVLLGIE